MDVTLRKANEHRNAWFEGVQKCNLDETLYVIMERIVRAEVHRLVIVDESDKVIGIISLSDILLYLVLRPSELASNASVSGSQHSLRSQSQLFDDNQSTTKSIDIDLDEANDSVFDDRNKPKNGQSAVSLSDNSSSNNTSGNNLSQIDNGKTKTTSSDANLNDSDDKKINNDNENTSENNDKMAENGGSKDISNDDTAQESVVEKQDSTANLTKADDDISLLA